MRIFAKKAFGFTNPDPSAEINGVRQVVRVEPLSFTDVPDWVANDDMFKWAKQDGDIEEIKTETAVDVKKPVAPVTPVAPVAPVAPVDDKAKSAAWNGQGDAPVKQEGKK